MKKKIELKKNGKTIIKKFLNRIKYIMLKELETALIHEKRTRIKTRPSRNIRRKKESKEDEIGPKDKYKFMMAKK